MLHSTMLEHNCVMSKKISTTSFYHTTCDGSEALLASCVPDLKLNPFVVQHNFLDLEVNPVQTEA